MQWLISLFTGPIVQAALGAYQKKLDAGNTSERIAAELAARELAVQQREREVSAEIIKAEQGNFITRIVRPLWAMPFIIWTWKVVIYDTVLGFGSTNELRGMVGALCVTVAGAYFGGRTIEQVARILRK